MCTCIYRYTSYNLFHPLSVFKKIEARKMYFVPRIVFPAKSCVVERNNSFSYKIYKEYMDVIIDTTHT